MSLISGQELKHSINSAAAGHWIRSEAGLWDAGITRGSITGPLLSPFLAVMSFGESLVHPLNVLVSHLNLSSSAIRAVAFYTCPPDWLIIQEIIINHPFPTDEQHSLPHGSTKFLCAFGAVSGLFILADSPRPYSRTSTLQFLREYLVGHPPGSVLFSYYHLYQVSQTLLLGFRNCFELWTWET